MEESCTVSVGDATVEGPLLYVQNQPRHVSVQAVLVERLLCPQTLKNVGQKA